ncbi:MAG: Asp23/Gls24 family envelope stress response protein [Chloroflexota bacterium]
MSGAIGPELTVGRNVIAQLVPLAAFEVPGVARVGHGGPPWRAWLAGLVNPPVKVRVHDGQVIVRLRIVARPGHAIGPLTAHVRTAVAATVERFLGLDLGAVTVIVDGVGG